MTFSNEQIAQAIVGLLKTCEHLANAVALQEQQIIQLRADYERLSVRESGDGMLITH